MLRLGSQEHRFHWCPAGSFRMGSPTSETGRDPNENQVDVTLARGYWMLETEVTQGLWQAVMGTKLNWSERGEAPNLPVYNVSHGEAEAFGARLTDLLRQGKELPAGLKITLPTEAQWENAARAGSTTRFPFGEVESTLGEHDWFMGNSQEKPHEVKTRQANPWGLYDMLGNVCEWCADGYAEHLTGGVDPHGPSRASCPVIRGGGWYSNSSFCRPASRSWFTADDRYVTLGFRVAVFQE